jgi:ATP synthase F1 complex assembly factor 2
MPLTSVAATAIDQPQPQEEVVETMLQYLHTDSLLCRAEPGPLADAQQEVR